MPEKNITCEIREHLGVIARYESGWRKELNLVSWNGGAPKYDVRDWDPYHERMSRGVTFHSSEMRKLVDLYISSNNRRAVREGEHIEAERREWRESYRRSRWPEKRDPALESVERDAYEGSQLPVREYPEGGEPELLLQDEAKPAGLSAGEESEDLSAEPTADANETEGGNASEEARPAQRAEGEASAF